uniref:Uncharacterized protein n=1 Tax=Anguilla anguilla TaxID=7936 RepID=A0A0E9VKF4_ANGAN
MLQFFIYILIILANNTCLP